VIFWIRLDECSITTFRILSWADLLGMIQSLKVSNVHDVDEKQVDFNGMTMVTVKCVDHGWTNGSEGD